MSEEPEDLVLALCTRAGMLMEDVSAEAIAGVERDPDLRTAQLARLQEAACDIRILIDAAEVLNRRSGD